jgi:hypothetical protein
MRVEDQNLTVNNLLFSSGTSYITSSGNADLVSLSATNIFGKGFVGNKVVTSNPDKSLGESAVTTTELGQLTGVTSNVQIQLNSKASGAATVNAGAGLTGGGAISASPTISMPNVGTVGTYVKVTTDAQGRVVTGQATITSADIGDIPWSKIVGEPTTLAGYGTLFDTKYLGLNAIANFALSAAQADKLKTGRTISITGDLTYTSPAFDGTTNVTAAGTLVNVGTAGTYTKVTTDSKGRVTSGGPMVAADLPTVPGVQGTYGSSGVIPVVTISDKGTVTGITTAPVSAAFAGARFETQQALTPGVNLVTVAHNLGSQFVQFQCFDTASLEQIIPGVEFLSGTQLRLTFVTTRSYTVKILVSL